MESQHSKPRYYMLVDREVVQTGDVRKWGEWFESADRTIARTEVTPRVSVSTVFLGLDHAWGGGPPVLYETMIFGGDHDGFQARYRSIEEAEDGHERAVKMVKGVKAIEAEG